MCVPCWKTDYKVAAIKIYGTDREINQKAHSIGDPASTQHTGRKMRPDRAVLDLRAKFSVTVLPWWRGCGMPTSHICKNQ